MIAHDLISVSELQRVLDPQIHTIAEEIYYKKDQLKQSGLLDGKAGIAILFAYLSKVFPEKNYLQSTFDFLAELEHSLSNDELNYNMSSGVAGIAFAFQHLRNMGVLDPAVDLNLSELDEFLSLGIDHDFIAGNWDPLHGMTGLGIYFLERYKETNEKRFLEKIVDDLALMRVQIQEHKVWITPGHEKYSNDNYNFGMAHGMPGILSFLAQVRLRGIKQNETEDLISSCMPFLLQHQYGNEEECCFPNSIEVSRDAEHKPASRLAWCYGDLCVANALIHCGKALQQIDWQNKGIEVALKTTQRNFENSGCVDAPFCHGTTGVAHQYNRLFQLTENEVFKSATERWINITLEQYYKPGQGASGYFFRCFNEETNSFENSSSCGLLEGSAGIALVYLSWLYNIVPGWDVIFLTNV